MIEDRDAVCLAIRGTPHIHPLCVLAPDLVIAQAFAVQDAPQTRGLWLFQAHRFGEANAEGSFFCIAEDDILVASSQGDLEIEEPLILRPLINAQRLGVADGN